jgi:hypothetical protein
MVNCPFAMVKKLKKNFNVLISKSLQSKGHSLSFGHYDEYSGDFITD